MSYMDIVKDPVSNYTEKLEKFNIQAWTSHA